MTLAISGGNGIVRLLKAVAGQAVPRADAGTKVDATLTALAATRVTLDSILREALPTTRSAVGRLTDSLKNARVAAGVSDKVSAQSAALGEKIGYAIVAKPPAFARPRLRSMSRPFRMSPTSIWNTAIRRTRSSPTVRWTAQAISRG